MYKSEISRIILFILFFSIGAASLGTSVLCDDLVKYYQNVQFTQSARQSVEKLEVMNEDYGSILNNLEDDPNYIKRIAPVVGGSEYLDANAAYPKATARELEMARKAFANSDEETIEPALPDWLSRCNQSRNKMILFFSGVALILISFVCFRPVKNSIE
jgi:hypothetical protein